MDRAEIVLDASQRLGDVVRLPTPDKRAYAVTHPRDIRRIMVENRDNYRKSFDYAILAELTGQGLITSDGETWKRDRKLAQPLFTLEMQKRYGLTMDAIADRLARQWGEEVARGELVQVDRDMVRLGIAVIGSTALGVDVTGHEAAIADSLLVAQKQVVKRGMAVVDVAKYLPTYGQYRFKREVAWLHGLLQQLVDARRARGPAPGETDLIEAFEGQDPRAIRDQAITFFLAGHETTAVALSWALSLLATHPEIQERVSAEAASVAAEGLRGFDAYTKLRYTRMAFEESMRLYPPGPFIGRENIEDDELGGFHIPAGSTLALCQYATHRRPDLWERAGEFDPERFSEERRSSIPSHAYFPFGGGPRVCIGQTLGMMEGVLTLARVAREFRMRPPEGEADFPPRPMSLVSLRPARPIRLRMEQKR
jgi:cytochrome P450